MIMDWAMWNRRISRFNGPRFQRFKNSPFENSFMKDYFSSTTTVYNLFTVLSHICR